nr:hypothetical protein [Variovorax paradoxus]
MFLAPFSLLWKRSAALRAAGWFCFYSVAVWLLTSRYPRYLTASFPLLALMAAIGWQVLFGGIAAGVRRVFGAKGGPVEAAPAAAAPAGRLALAGDWIVVLLLAALAAVSLRQTAGKVAMISPTPETREAFLRQHVPGYAAMDYLRQHADGRVYQIALNEAIYYGPNPIWGDTLGPWRYRDFLLLLPGDMARKLAAKGFTAIVMPTSMVPTLATRPGFDEHFALLYEKDGGRVYRILSTAP